MASNEELDELDQLRQRLEEAKRVFSAKVLENDILYRAVLNALAEIDNRMGKKQEEPKTLPTFRAEPWQSKGGETRGLLITASASLEVDEMDEQNIGFSAIEHIPIYTVTKPEGSNEVTALIVKELAALGSQEEVLAAAQHYDTAEKELLEKFPDLSRLVAEPVLGTIILRDDVPQYQSETPEEARPADS